MLGLVIFPSYFGIIHQRRRDPKDFYLARALDPEGARRLEAKVTGIIRWGCGGRGEEGFISASLT